MKGKMKTKEKICVVVDAGITKRICHIYGLMNSSARKSVKYGIELGGMLDTQKNNLEHGEWETWVKDNLPFSPRMARKYMKLWKHRAQLKTELSSANDEGTLSKALRMLVEPDNAVRDFEREETKKRRRDYASMDHKFNNPKGIKDEIIAGDNIVVLPRMIQEGAKGNVTLVVTSPMYNNRREYGPEIDDDKPYDEYLNDLLKPFAYYAELLRPGGRAVVNIASVVEHKQRDEDGQPYYHLVADDLCRRVEQLGLGFRFYDRIIWYKPSSNPCDNNKWGTFANPEMPLMRTRFEYVLVWAYQQFNLPNINNVTPDITPDEYKEWSTNVWQIAPHISKGNPNSSAMPEKLAERIIKIYSRPDDWVIDPHCGSGTVPKVCKDLCRHYTGIDLQKGQCKYAKARVSAA